VQARTDGARYEHEVVVNPSLCASCGICAGSCPASNPFRSSRETLKTGIDMPQLPVDEMRRLARETVETMSGDPKIIVFGCEHGLNVDRLKRDDTRGIKLMCSGMLPPTLVEPTASWLPVAGKTTVSSASATAGRGFDLAASENPYCAPAPSASVSAFMALPNPICVRSKPTSRVSVNIWWK
jgi:ferredoxin